MYLKQMNLISKKHCLLSFSNYFLQKLTAFNRKTAAYHRERRARKKEEKTAPAVAVNPAPTQQPAATTPLQPRAPPSVAPKMRRQIGCSNLHSGLNFARRIGGCGDTSKPGVPPTPTPTQPLSQHAYNVCSQVNICVHVLFIQIFSPQYTFIEK